MNIFVLDTDPKIAASYHCDQHLHKMILESAQMISTAILQTTKKHSIALALILYKPAYPNHPCTRWVKESTSNISWLIHLCEELEQIRQSLGMPEHASMKVVKAAKDWIYPSNIPPKNFVFAGPPSIEIRNLTIPQKYQMYYRQKHRAWLDTRAPMSYKNRPIPPFLQDLFA